MTRLLDSLAARPAAQRILLALLLAFVGLFLLGVTVGVIAAAVSHGRLPAKLWVLALPLFAAPLGLAGLFASWRLAAPPKTASAYEKRYWRMWLLIVLLSTPIGILLGSISQRSGMAALNPFSDTPISAVTAIVLVALITGLAGLAITLYHRAVDDHEERAYLWGSQLAYYFLILAFPAWWLLERGGLVGAITTAGALGAILVSLVVQGAVWAWLKFR